MDRWVPNSFLWVVKNLDSGQVHAEHLMAFTFCSEKKLVSVCDKAIGSCSFPLGGRRLGNQSQDKHV